jgi:hypothetical protein
MVEEGSVPMVGNVLEEGGSVPMVGGVLQEDDGADQMAHNVLEAVGTSAAGSVAVVAAGSCQERPLRFLEEPFCRHWTRRHVHHQRPQREAAAQRTEKRPLQGRQQRSHSPQGLLLLLLLLVVVVVVVVVLEVEKVRIGGEFAC